MDKVWERYKYRIKFTIAVIFVMAFIIGIIGFLIYGFTVSPQHTLIGLGIAGGFAALCWAAYFLGKHFN